jgi:RHS repeat-associated protein
LNATPKPIPIAMLISCLARAMDPSLHVIPISTYTSTDAWGTQNYNFKYDDLYQLTSEAHWQTHQYEHDSLQNRVEHDNNHCAVDELNQLVQEGDCHYIYNADGCLTHRTTPTEEISYAYDSANRLTRIETTTNKTAFIYDPLDRRLSKTVHDLKMHSQSTTRYLFDGQNEIGAVNEQDSITELRVLGQGLGAEIGAAVAIEINGYAYAPIHDHRGNVVALLYTNYFGNCIPYENYRYSAFGEEKILQLTTVNPWRFSSKRTENSLVLFGKRYYDPATGRWLSPDPEGFHDGPNLYAYVHNNPLTHFDLYGLKRELFQHDDLFESDLDAYVGVYYSGLARGVSKGAVNRFANLVGGENIFSIASGNVDHNDFFAHASAHGEIFGDVVGQFAAESAIGGAAFKTLSTGYHLWQASRAFGYAGSLGSTLYAGSRLKAPSSLWATTETFTQSNARTLTNVANDTGRNYNPIWSSTKEKSSVQNAYQHWKMHGKEFPGLNNAKEYVDFARNFLKTPSPGTFTHTRASGDFLRYCPKNNTFGTMTKSGVPRTLFKPDVSKHRYPTNLDYFYAQK